MLLNVLLLIVLSPIYLTGLIGNFTPLYFSNLLCKKLIKSKEFYSSFALGFAMVLFLINYLIIYFLFNSFFENAIFSIFGCALLMLCGGLSLGYHSLLKETISGVKILTKKTFFMDLRLERVRLKNFLFSES
jgi:hypothetical protein